MGGCGGYSQKHTAESGSNAHLCAHMRTLPYVNVMHHTCIYSIIDGVLVARTRAQYTRTARMMVLLRVVLLTFHCALWEGGSGGMAYDAAAAAEW